MFEAISTDLVQKYTSFFKLILFPTWCCLLYYYTCMYNSIQYICLYVLWILEEFLHRAHRTVTFNFPIDSCIPRRKHPQVLGHILCSYMYVQ
jgi:hypothetical protein